MTSSFEAQPIQNKAFANQMTGFQIYTWIF